MPSHRRTTTVAVTTALGLLAALAPATGAAAAPAASAAVAAPSDAPGRHVVPATDTEVRFTVPGHPDQLSPTLLTALQTLLTRWP